MDAVARYTKAEALLQEALELHRLASKNNANDYMAVRRLKKRGEAVWEDVETYLELMRNGDVTAEAEQAEAPLQDADNAATETAPRLGRRRRAAKA